MVSLDLLYSRGTYKRPKIENMDSEKYSTIQDSYSVIFSSQWVLNKYL